MQLPGECCSGTKALVPAARRRQAGVGPLPLTPTACPLLD